MSKAYLSYAPTRSYRRRRPTLLHIAFAAAFISCLSYLFLHHALSQAAGTMQDHSVVGSPSLDAHFINRVLAHYHSPAAGKGQALYNDGVKYGIDPAYALAFFMHESSFGTQGVALVTHSLGNIRASTGYRAYASWEAGFDDWYRLIANQYVAQWGLSTVDQIIPVYAPASDNNDEGAYIQAVKTAVDTWHSGTIDV